MRLYPDLFEGVGTMKNAVVHLDIKPDATPIVCLPRRVPDALHDDLKAELDQMESMKVICKLDINEASDWVHVLVLVVKPNGRLRVCLDPRTLNTVLQHNIHNAQRFVDIIAQVRGFTHCSKIDANSGFWTLPLDTDSQLLTKFDTQWGRYCFLKLPFGLCESQYFFQFYMDLNFKAINDGTHVIVDDVLIVGDSSKTTGNHDQRLIKVLNKCHEIGLKLNPDKCIFKSTEVLFFGHLVTSMGLKPDPKKIEAIVQMPVPQNKAQLQSFIGLCNYLTCYVPHLTNVLLPLCALTVKTSEFQWEKLHSDAYAKAKQAIANSCTLQYFNSKYPIIIKSMPAVLESVLCCCNKAMLYHTIPGLLHPHNTIFGCDFVVHTYHQPLVQLTKKPLCEISPRLQCLLLKVTQYSFNTVYIKHEGVPIADCLSRNLTIDSAKDESLNITIAMISLFQEGKLHQIKWETAKDVLLVKLACVIQNGWPSQCADLDQELYVFYIHRLNLSVVDGIIMNGTGIVIPKSFQAEYLKCLHTGHFRISKCQA